MRNVAVWTLLWLMLPLSSGWAQLPTSSAAPTLPPMPQATLQIPWTEFKGMLDSLRRAEEIYRLESLPKENPPPVPWSITQATYDAEAVDNASVRVRASMKVMIWDKNWVSIPVLGDAVAMVSITLDNAPAHLAADSRGWLVLQLNEPGEHDLNVEFFVKAENRDGVVSFEFPMPSTPMTLMSLRIPEPGVTISAPMASNITATPDETGVTAELAFRRADSIAVEWTLKTAELAAPPPERVQPRVAASAMTLATATESYVSCNSLIRYAVLRGEVDTFVVTLPTAASVSNVAGQGAAWTSSELDGRQRLEIKTNHLIGDEYTITLSYEMPYSGELAAIPDLQFIDVVRQSGYVGIEARGNIEVSPSPTLEGLSRIDAAELPVELLGLAANPVLLAFRYDEGGWNLATSVRRLQDVAVPDSTIDQALLTTVVTEEGMAVTRIVYDVRNSVRQFLRVDLNPKAEVWSAEVGNQLVKPARDGENGAVLIPLFKSVGTGQRLGTFPVTLVYMERTPKRDGFAQLGLVAPSTDILTSQVTWDVLLPESMKLFRSTGDVQRETIAVAGPSRRRPVVRTSTEIIQPTKEGIERFMITDINNPAGALNIGQPRYTGAPLKPGAENVAPAVAAIAGVLPVRIALPESGVPYRFSKILAGQGVALHLELSTYPAWVSRIATYMALINATALGACLAFLALRLINHKRVTVLGTVSLILAATLAAFTTSADLASLSAALVTVGGAALAFAVHFSVQWRSSMRDTKIANTDSLEGASS